MSETPRRQPGELVFTLALLAGSVFLLWQAFGISRFDSITSAGVFPMAAAAVMAISSVVVLVRALRQRPAEPEHGESMARLFARRMMPRVLLGFVLAITAYMLLLQPLGFLLASYLFLVVSMGLLGSRRWGLNLLVSALSLGAIYLVFETVFSVVLPKGSWLAGWLR